MQNRYTQKTNLKHLKALSIAQPTSSRPPGGGRTWRPLNWHNSGLPGVKHRQMVGRS